MTIIFNKIMDLFLGPKDENGKIKYTRPLIISAILFLLFSLLTYVTSGFFLILILLVGVWSWIIISSNREANILKQKDELLSLIIDSKITSTHQLAKYTGIGYHEVEKLLLDMIKSSTHIKSGYIKKTTNRYAHLKNASLNLNTHEIQLDAKASNTVLDKVGDAANSVLDRFVPRKEIPKPDWKCHYCASLNKSKSYNCEYCGAGKSEV